MGRYKGWSFDKGMLNIYNIGDLELPWFTPEIGELGIISNNLQVGFIFN